MPTAQSIREKLEYLVRATGRAEADIMAQAVQDGIDDIYRKQIAEAYLSNQLDRPDAVAELGADAVDELDFARRAVESDVKWGLKSA